MEGEWSVTASICSSLCFAVLARSVTVSVVQCPLEMSHVLIIYPIAEKNNDFKRFGKNFFKLSKKGTINIKTDNRKRFASENAVVFRINHTIQQKLNKKPQKILSYY